MAKPKPALGEVYVEGPEFETISLLGSNCLIGEISEMAYANYVCDELGTGHHQRRGGLLLGHRML